MMSCAQCNHVSLDADKEMLLLGLILSCCDLPHCVKVSTWAEECNFLFFIDLEPTILMAILHNNDEAQTRGKATQRMKPLQEQIWFDVVRMQVAENCIRIDMCF